MTFTKRVAVVTGGTRGIGAQISIALKNAGHTVIATYQSDTKVAESFEELTQIATRQFDVTCFESCQSHIQEITQSYGPVEILVNNAGITKDMMLHKMDVFAWNDVLSTNLTSCFNMSRSVIESMRARKYGRIINISSINGQKGQAGQCNYAAAKLGLIGFSRALAQESGSKGITVNVIAPGHIDAGMSKELSPELLENIISRIPLNRLGKAEEIAAAVVYLTQESSSFITGATLSINGGAHFS